MCFNNAPMPHEDLIETVIHCFAELSEAVNQRGLKVSVNENFSTLLDVVFLGFLA